LHPTKKRALLCGNARFWLLRGRKLDVSPEIIGGVRWQQVSGRRQTAEVGVWTVGRISNHAVDHERGFRGERGNFLVTRFSRLFSSYASACSYAKASASQVGVAVSASSASWIAISQAVSWALTPKLKRAANLALKTLEAIS
jgi:hypothetical protein